MATMWVDAPAASADEAMASKAAVTPTLSSFIVKPFWDMRAMIA